MNGIDNLNSIYHMYDNTKDCDGIIFTIIYI
jgi:hypothetical protein